MCKKQATWQTQSSRVVYDNPWISVFHRDVIAPTGKAGIYGVVHFKNHAIAIIPIDADGNTWLVGQHRYAIDQYSWEVPEGGAPLAESPLAAARRELREESGIIAGRWTSLLSAHLSNSVSDEISTAYVAQQLSFTEVEPDDTESIELRKLPLDDAIAMALDGTITDAFSMMSLFKVKLMIDKGELVI